MFRAMNGYVPNPWMISPFLVLLAMIAVGPLWFPNWWNRHYPKVSYALGAICIAYYLLALPRPATIRVLQTAHEYISFIALIGALYVVSGGIHIIVKGEATPLANMLFLLFGGVMANFLGTTGASMLLIRPWIRMNRYRITAYHIVFFIFIISNVGGGLTPVGDPPLFLGYLNGVPFWWVTEHCWPMWIVGMAMLLMIFYFLDCHNYLRAPKRVREELAEPPDVWRFEGLGNIFFLAVILAAVFFNHPIFLREVIMVAAALASWFLTPRTVHEANHFNFHPLIEVVVLFAGIFATMIPALDWLQANASKIQNPTPAAFYWASGTLSSVLDNAPTYLSFFSAILGALTTDHATVASTSQQAQVLSLLANPEAARFFIAISVGAVFFGANTYIGNGPNFMVRSIAHDRHIKCPSFLGYVFNYTIPMMVPVLVVIWFLFFR